MLSCSIWFSVPNLWMRGGLESQCVGRVYGVVGAYGFLHRVFGWMVVLGAHPKIRCRKPYAATQHLMLLMMGVCTRNTSS